MEDYNKKIIEEIAKELNMSKHKVEQVSKFFFNWQRQKFIECENREYIWKGFGKFKILQNKYNRYLDYMDSKTNKNKTNKEEK